MMRDKVLAVLLTIGAMALGTLSATAESFDKPLKVKTVDLGRSQYLMPKSDQHVMLTCSYYPDFMMKQLVDPGLKGAVSISLVPVHTGDTIRCTQSRSPGEKVFKDHGYFSGVKRYLVFIDAEDGTNGGMPFTVYDSRTWAKVFRDSVTHSNGSYDMDFVEVSDTQIIVRYLRVFSGECSIPTHGEACWKTFKQQTGLIHAPMPNCSTFEGVDQGDIPSVIAYPVEVSLFPKPSRKIIGNPARCYAVE